MLDSEQGKGIGKALLLRCLHALRAEGYAYAIIGGVGAGGLLRKVRGRPGDSRFHTRDLPDFLAAIEKGAMGTGEE